MNLKNLAKTLAPYILTISGKISNYVFLLFIAIYFIQLYGKEQYGIFVIYLSLSRILAIIFNFGFSNRTLKEVTPLEDEKDISSKITEILINTTAFSVGLSLLVFGFYKLAGLAFHNLTYITVLYFTGITLRVYINLFMQIYRATNKIYLFAFTEVPVYLGIIFFGIYAGELSSESSIFILVNSWAVSVVLHLFYIKKYLVIKPLRKYYDDLKKFVSSQQLKENFVVAQNNVISLSSKDIVPLIMGIFGINTIIISNYDVISKIASLSTFILSATNPIVGPKSVKMFSKNKIKEFFLYAKNISLLIQLGSIPYFVALIFFSDYIIGNFFKSETTIPLLPLFILSIGFQFHAVSGPNVIIMNLNGHERKIRSIMLSSFVVYTIILSLFLNFVNTDLLLAAVIIQTLYMILWNSRALRFLSNNYGYSTIFLPFLDKVQIKDWNLLRSKSKI